MSVPSVPKQFVYAQQDILGGTTKTNDLVVVNDKDYKDSGICVGPGGPYNNMRLSYSVNEAAGNITTDTLNVNVEQLFFKNLPSSQNIRKICNYLVADSSGNVKEGYAQFNGDINLELSTIKDDIILIKQSLGLPVIRTTSIESILSYIAIGLCILFLIILIILLIRMHKLTKRLQKAEDRVEELELPSSQMYYTQQPFEGSYPQSPVPSMNAYPQSPIPSMNAYPRSPVSSMNAYPRSPVPSMNAYPQSPVSSMNAYPQSPVSSTRMSPPTRISRSVPGSPTAFSGYRYYY